MPPAILGAFSLAKSHWKLIGLGLLLMALAVQSVRLGHRTNQLERERINSNELRAELKAISDKKNEQKAETERNIDKAEQGEREAKPIVEKIRNAPIVPGKCATPGIEILRNEI